MRRWLPVTLLVATMACLAGCGATAVGRSTFVAQPGEPPIRFLLTFDDGPSGEETANSTAQILDTLARNRWQKNIKAIFFVQTRHPAGGDTEMGAMLMARMHAEGHQLGLHTASARGHIKHTTMPLAELDRTLEDGIEDIRYVTGDVPRFLRPPYWAFNAATVARYEAYGLTMLLDDISLGDGKVRGVTSNPQARQRIRTNMRRAARQIRAGDIPAMNGYIPLVVTMHDTNPTTAQDLESYLGMLIEEARAAGLAVDATPFVAPGRELSRAASLRANRPSYAHHSGDRSYR